MPVIDTGSDRLDEIVTRHLNANIDALTKGREQIVTPRSRELLVALAGNVVLDVLAELLAEGGEDDGEA
jgi:hypothetical protein